MKRSTKAQLFAASGAMFFSSMFLNGLAVASTFSWSAAPGTAIINTASNWSPVTANGPGGSDDIFFGASNTTVLSLTSGQNKSYFNLTFNSDAPSYTIGDVGGTTSITLGANGNPPTGGNITNNSAVAQTFNAPVAIRRGTINAAVGDIVFNNTFNVGNNGTGASTALRNITVAGSHNVYFAGQLLGSATPFPAGIPDDDITNLDNGRLIKDGSGTLFLTNNTNNTNFTGPITVNSGAVRGTVDNAFGASGTVTIGTSTVTLGGTHVSGAANTGRVEILGGISYAPETLVLEGRTVSDTQLLNVSGNNTWTGPVNIVAGLGGGSLAIQSDDGTLTVSGNVTNIAGDTIPRTLALRGAGNGVISGNITENLTSANLSPFKDGTGAWTLTGANSYSGTTTVNAGTLNVGVGGTTGSVGSGTIILSGGTLVFNRSDNVTLSNAISGTSGGLIHAGNSQLTLGGTLSYQGSTRVQSGTLALSASKTGGGAITVDAGAALTISSTVPSTTLASSAFNVAGSTINFALGLNGNPTQALVSTTSLTRNGSNVINILGSNFSVGTVALIQYSGSAGGSGNFTLGSLPNRMLASLVDTGSSLNLNITGIDFPRWTGAVSNVWDNSTLSNPKNWVLNSNGTTPTDYIQGDSVLFSDASSVNNVSISGTVTPNSITVNNSSKNYEFSGSGGISGSATLIKTGTGTLTFTNSGLNDFSGAISIGAGGTIAIGNGGSSGSIGTGTITNSGVLALNRSDGAALANVIAGTGNIQVNANSKATLSGNSTFDGGVVVQSGAALFINHANALGSAIGATTINGGASLIVGNGGSIVFAAEPITVGGTGNGSGAGAIHAVGTLASNLTGVVTLSANTTLSAEASATGILSGAMNGAGKDITVTGGGTVVLAGAGNSYANSIVSQGTLQFGNSGSSGDLGSGTVGIASGAAVNFSRTDLHTVSNVISGDGSIAKSAGGTLVLAANNTFTGSVNINSGVIRATNANAFGGGAKTIVADTRNRGIELDGGVTIPSNISYLLSNDGDLAQAGATVPFAIRSLTGSNTIAGDIQLKTGGGSSVIKVDAGGTLNVNGNISIQFGQGGRAIQLGGAGTGCVNGVISDGPTGELMSIAVVGTGQPTWTLNNANTLSGNVALQSGTLELKNNQSLGTTFGTYCFIGNGGGAFANVPAALNIAMDGITISNNLWTNRDGAGATQLPDAERTNRHIGYSAPTGTGTFSGAVQINGGAVFHATPSGTLVMSGVLQNGTEAFSNGGRNDVFINAAGTVIFSGANTYTGFTETHSGTLLLLGSASAPILTGAGADLRGGRIVIDYNGGSDPTPTVYAGLQTGFAANFATGQIRSTNATESMGIGFKDDTGAQRLHLMRTYYGDANLDGTVSSVDFDSLIASYGATSGKVWVDGDFNYDGKVSTLDFNYIAGNFGATVSAPLPGSGLGAVVPEPASALSVLLAGLMLRRRR